MNNDMKATVLGVLGAIGVAVWPLIQTGKFSWGAVLAAALVAANGYITNKPTKPA